MAEYHCFVEYIYFNCNQLSYFVNRFCLLIYHFLRTIQNMFTLCMSCKCFKNSLKFETSGNVSNSIGVTQMWID